MGVVCNGSNFCQENIFEIIRYIKFSFYSTKFNRDFLLKHIYLRLAMKINI